MGFGELRMNTDDHRFFRRSCYIRFLPLKKEYRAKIVQSYFQFPELNENERRTFTDITGLKPGDVRAEWRKYGSSPSLSAAGIAEELKQETGYRE